MDDNTGPVQVLLNSLAAKVRNLQPPLKSFTEYLATETRKEFDSGTDPSGKPWRPLSPRYLREKLSKGYPSTPLTRTGAMRRTIYASASRDAGVFGLTSPLAAIHQRDRPIVALTPQRMEMLRSLIKSYLESN